MPYTIQLSIDQRVFIGCQVSEYNLYRSFLSFSVQEDNVRLLLIILPAPCGIELSFWELSAQKFTAMSRVCHKYLSRAIGFANYPHG